MNLYKCPILQFLLGVFFREIAKDIKGFPEELL
jgi:hypothetical protein